MKKAAFLILISLLCSFNLSFSQAPSIGQIEKTQQDIEMEKTLRTEAEKGKKSFIKNIEVKGASLITADQIKEIILPFKNHWLTGNDINLILNSIASAYKQKGYEGQPEKISFQIKKGLLEITVEELRH